MNSALSTLFARAESWPDAAQAELLTQLQEIEAKYGLIYRLSESEHAAIQQGLQEIEAGALASDAEMTELFARYRG